MGNTGFEHQWWRLALMYGRSISYEFLPLPFEQFFMAVQNRLFQYYSLDHIYGMNKRQLYSAGSKQKRATLKLLWFLP